MSGQTGCTDSLKKVVEVVVEVGDNGTGGKLDSSAGTVVKKEGEGDAVQQLLGGGMRYAGDEVLGARLRLDGAEQLL